MIKTQNLHCRWMIRRDMPEVLQIDYDSNALPWEEEDFLSHLRRRNCIGIVGELEDKVVGFMIYSLHKDHLQIHNFGINLCYRHQSHGTKLISSLREKLSAHRRTSIIIHVPESNLPFLLFLKKQDFRCKDILHNQYQLSNEDTYIMEYNHA